MGIKHYSATPFGITSVVFCPKIKTLELIKLISVNYRIIEILSQEHEPTARSIARKLNIEERRTRDILKDFEKGGILKSKRDQRNSLHWSFTHYRAPIIIRLFVEMCNIIESPVYRATDEEITGCLNLIKKQDSQSRYIGLKYLKKLSLVKSVRHKPEVMKLLMELLQDPANDGFKDEVVNCLLMILPSPLKYPNKRDKIEQLDAEILEKHLEELNGEELLQVLKEFYPEKTLTALHRYCFNEPLSPVTIPLTLTLMRLIDEELAVKNIVKMVEKPPIPLHYHSITMPASGLSSIMKDKLRNEIMDLANKHSDENVRQRASEMLTILIDIL